MRGVTQNELREGKKKKKDIKIFRKKQDMLKLQTEKIRKKERQLSIKEESLEERNNILFNIKPKRNTVDQEDESEIIQQINENMNRKPSGCRFNDEIYAWALDIMSTSPEAYDIIRRKLPLPSRISLYNKFHEQVNTQVNNLLSLEKILDVIDQWRKISHVNCKSIVDCILSVDAVFSALKYILILMDLSAVLTTLKN